MRKIQIFSQKVIKIRSLLPVLKEKKRYILYQIDGLNKSVNSVHIENGIRSFIGDLGLAKAGLMFIKNKNNRYIVKVNNKSVSEIRTGLSLIKKIDNNPVRIRTLKVSGVVNKLKELI